MAHAVAAARARRVSKPASLDHVMKRTMRDIVPYSEYFCRALADSWCARFKVTDVAARDEFWARIERISVPCDPPADDVDVTLANQSIASATGPRKKIKFGEAHLHEWRRFTAARGPRPVEAAPPV